VSEGQRCSECASDRGHGSETRAAAGVSISDRTGSIDSKRAGHMKGSAVSPAERVLIEYEGKIKLLQTPQRDLYGAVQNVPRECSEQIKSADSCKLDTTAMKTTG
jgi:hypothetical protein